MASTPGRVTRALAAAVAVLITSACAQNDTSSASPVPAAQDPTPEVSSEAEPVLNEPPPLTLTARGETYTPQYGSWCWQLTCADGGSGAGIHITGADTINVSFPEPGWTFRADFQRADQTCPREQRVELTGDAAQGLALLPAGAAGTYDVRLVGNAPEDSGGSVGTSFRWTTPMDGPLAQPEAWVTAMDIWDGPVNSYGVDLGIANMATTPKVAEASMTVTSAEGRSVTLPLTRDTGVCQTEGSLLFHAPEEDGDRAVATGSPPYTWDVVVVMDGVEHRARAVWPQDDPGDNSGTMLRFEPALPSLDAAAR